MEDREYQFLMSEFEALRSSIETRYSVWVRLCEHAALLSIAGIVFLKTTVEQVPPMFWLAIVGLNLWAIWLLFHQEKIIRGIKGFLSERETQLFLNESDFTGWHSINRQNDAGQPTTLAHCVITRIVPALAAAWAAYEFIWSLHEWGAATQ